MPKFWQICKNLSSVVRQINVWKGSPLIFCCLHSLFRTCLAYLSGSYQGRYLWILGMGLYHALVKRQVKQIIIFKTLTSSAFKIRVYDSACHLSICTLYAFCGLLCHHLAVFLAEDLPRVLPGALRLTKISSCSSLFAQMLA